MEGVRDHIVSIIHLKVTPYDIWEALTDLIQSSNDHRKLALMDKLRKIKMEKNDTIPVYLTKFVQCRDELGSVGVSVADDDYVHYIIINEKLLDDTNDQNLLLYIGFHGVTI